MLASLVCAIAFGQNAQVKALMTPESFLEPVRLAMSPKLDGVIGGEEWDALFSDASFQSFLQWSPGELHIAGKLPVGQDILVSFDRGTNGWLIGDDNIEFRIGLRDGKPVLKVRQLNASGVAGPRWVDGVAYEKASTIATKVTGNTWSVEATFVDPGSGIIPHEPTKVALRVDTVAYDAPALEPFYPRSLTPVQFAYERTTGLPPGVTWTTELNGLRSVVPGNTLKLKHVFHGKDDSKLKKLDMRNEGDLKEAAAQIALPFAGFDRKGKAVVDYESAVQSTAPKGWFVHRAAVTAADGIVSLVQASVRVAPFVEMSLNRETIPGSAKMRIEKFDVWIQSHSENRIDGVLVVTPPAGWRVAAGNTSAYINYHSRGRIRKRIEIEIPEKAVGTFPITLTSDIGGQTVSDTAYLTIQPIK